MAHRIRNLTHGQITIVDGTSPTPNTLIVPIEEGNLRFSVRRPVKVIMNRGRVDSFAEGNEEPMTVSFTAKFEEWTGRTLTAYAAVPSVPDALRQRGNASAWVSSLLCGPYCTDLRFDLDNPCPTAGVDQTERLTFPDFHADETNFEEGDDSDMIPVSGVCLALEPTAVRGV